MSSLKKEIKVQGQTILVELGPGTETEVVDISKDMTRVASQIAWWSSVKAGALAEQEMIDAAYRNWRAKKAVELTSDEKKKLPEWQVKNHIEAELEFLKHKKAQAVALENVTLADGMVQAFLKKANILQSKGANIRAEIDTQDLRTPEEPAEEPAKKNHTVAPAVDHKAEAGSESDDDDDIPPSWGQSKTTNADDVVERAAAQSFKEAHGATLADSKSTPAEDAKSAAARMREAMKKNKEKKAKKNG